MFRRIGMRFNGIVLFVLMVALAVPSVVSAGGWVVITLDRLPERVIAGQTYTIGLMARQHGVRPWQTEALQVEAKHVETGQTVSFTAQQDQQPGHYQVDLSFPRSGRWEWGIAAGMFPAKQPMPDLEVLEGSSGAGKIGDGSIMNFARFPIRPPFVFVISTLLAFTVGTVLFIRARNGRFNRLAGAGWSIVFAGLLFTIFSSADAELRQNPSGSTTVVEASTGQQLFLAKGCVVCHTNDRAIQGSAEYGVNMGPDLTAYRNDSDHLRQFLKDPQSLKPGTEMPNLELKYEEIEALVRFLNDHE